LEGEEEIESENVVNALNHSMDLILESGPSHADKRTRNKDVCNG